MGSEQSLPSTSGVHPRNVLSSPSSPSSRHFDPLLSLSGANAFSAAVERQDSVASSDVESSSHEVPYVPYTVNRPIGGGNGGDSPKKKKAPASSSTTSRLRFGSKLQKSAHNTLVVVGKEASSSSQEEQLAVSSDPELSRLRDIPSFLPIMRASLSGNAGVTKDPDILERLDCHGLLALTQRYEDHLRLCAATVTADQAEIVKSVRATDQKILLVTQSLAERQKKMSKHAERLAKVSEMSACLDKCHLLLNENIEQMEVLNNMLPAGERLEPFVWTTG